MCRIILVLFVLATSISCQKYETVVVPDNAAPPDGTIEKYLMENYVHKVYIALLGRDAEADEVTSAMATLENDNFSEDSRKALLEVIMNRNEYGGKMFDIIRIEIMNSLDTNDVAFFIDMFENALSDPGQSASWPIVQYEVNRLYDYRYALPEYLSGDIDMKSVYARSVNNLFYDEINMGTENFVRAVFQNMLNRYPTQSELENAKLMVVGQNASLFLETGKSKTDFVNIFFNSDNYYEGRVRYLFTKYLFRNPTSEEMLFYTDLYKGSGNFKTLHSAIFATDEYAGL